MSTFITPQVKRTPSWFRTPFKLLAWDHKLGSNLPYRIFTYVIIVDKWVGTHRTHNGCMHCGQNPVEIHNERKLYTHDIHREVWAEETHNERKLYTRHTQGGTGRGDAQWEKTVHTTYTGMYGQKRCTVRENCIHMAYTGRYGQRRCTMRENYTHERHIW